MGEHSGNDCNLMYYEDLGTAWYTNLRRLAVPTTYKQEKIAKLMMDWVGKIPKGKPMKQSPDRCTNSTDAIKLLQIQMLKIKSRMPIPATYLEARVMELVKTAMQAATVTATVTTVAKTTQVELCLTAHQNTAMILLAKLMIADHDERSSTRPKVVRAIKKFLTGGEDFDELKEENEKSGKAYNKLPVQLMQKYNDVQKMAHMLLQKNFTDNHWHDKVVVLNQSVNDLSYELIPQLKSGKYKGFKLFWLDPWYWAKNQPTPMEIIKWRHFLDLTSLPGSIVLVWGRCQYLMKIWEKIFTDPIDSQNTWFVDPQVFVICRSKQHDKYTHNQKTLHSMTEFVLKAVRGVPTGANKTKGKAVQIQPDVLFYDAELRQHCGEENGYPGNVLLNVKPPAASARLKDYNGKPMRVNGEKSVALVEYFLRVFHVGKGDLMFDGYAGTMSAAMAAVKVGCDYFGTELNTEVCEAAMTRTMKFCDMASRGDFTHMKTAGAYASALAQVCFCVCHLCVLSLSVSPFLMSIL
jgi:hypothetical protein